MAQPVSKLRKDLDTLRRQVTELRGQEYAVGAAFDKTGRSGPRLPTPAQIDKLVTEIVAVSGQSAGVARRNVTIAFRNVIALEALAVGRLAGSTQNVCGKLATIPLLDPPNDDVLEIGTLYGLFSATLMRMLHRARHRPPADHRRPAGRHPSCSPAVLRASTPPARRCGWTWSAANLVLGGKAGEQASVQQGFSDDPKVRGDRLRPEVRRDHRGR